MGYRGHDPKNKKRLSTMHHAHLHSVNILILGQERFRQQTEDAFDSDTISNVAAFVLNVKS